MIKLGIYIFLEFCDIQNVTNNLLSKVQNKNLANKTGNLNLLDPVYELFIMVKMRTGSENSPD